MEDHKISIFGWIVGIVLITTWLSLFTFAIWSQHRAAIVFSNGYSLGMKSEKELIASEVLHWKGDYIGRCFITVANFTGLTNEEIESLN